MKVNKKNDLKKLNGIYSTVRVGSNVFFYGKDFMVVSHSGYLLLHKPDLKHVHKIAPLSDAHILIACGSRKAYILLDIWTGEELQEYRFPKHDSCLFKLVRANDGCIYDVFFYQDRFFYIKINPNTEDLCWDVIPGNIQVPIDMACDENGMLCLLQTQLESVGSRNISQNGVQLPFADFSHTVSRIVWKEKWEFTFPRQPLFFYRDADHILTNDLHIYHISSKEIKPLQQVDKILHHQHLPPLNYYYDATSNLLYLYYLNTNVVIDCVDESIVGQYATNGSCGTVIDGQFWIVTESGLQKRPFPLIENVSYEKPTLWKPWD